MPVHNNSLQVVPYDASWPAMFVAEADRIRAALGTLALRVDHHGSTAIPGLSAKPVIDIQVSVAELQPIAAYGDRLRAIGYVHVPDPDDSFCPFFHRPAQWPHSHHVHLVAAGGTEERRTLAFRDYLCDHAAAAREYEQLKRALATQFTADSDESREAYAAAKSEFIERAIALALSSGYPHVINASPVILTKEVHGGPGMKTFIVDSFTDAPFKGNPAGVCIVESPLSEATMLHVAQELNLSETAFIQRQGDSDTFSIRFFSPKMEIALCGHATLASAKVVFAIHELNEVHFINIQNLDLSAKESDGQIVMEFPVYETQPAEAPPALLAALGISEVKNAVYNVETTILMLEIADPQELAALNPDYAALYRSHHSINGILVTAASGTDGYDFHSRYFWPWSGTDEDPVTGGTHTFLTKYWSTRLGKTKMKSFQSSKRTGFMEVELTDGKLLIKGQAVIVFEGELTIPVQVEFKNAFGVTW